jgi:hypothetical protein
VARAKAADLGVRVAEPGRIRHHAKLALQREREADADRKSVDRGNERLLEIGIRRLPAAAPEEERVVGILVLACGRLSPDARPGT